MGSAILEALKIDKDETKLLCVAPTSFLMMLPLLGSSLEPLTSFFSQAYLLTRDKVKYYIPLVDPEKTDRL
jgi:hypothetical protein